MPNPKQQCGYCSGSGRVPGRKYDNHGKARPDWPDYLTCEYCGGSGQCEDGRKLLPASQPEPITDDGSPPAGTPSWA